MRILLPILLCLAALPAAGQQFYSWRDANGVRHFSQTPPPHNDYQSRTIRTRARPAETAGAAPAAAASTNPACTRARANIAVFAANDRVSMDRDGDGQAEVLDASARAAELDRALKTAETACKNP
jgi:hypothetical protein